MKYHCAADCGQSVVIRVGKLCVVVLNLVAYRVGRHSLFCLQPWRKNLFLNRQKLLFFSCATHHRQPTYNMVKLCHLLVVLSSLVVH